MKEKQRRKLKNMMQPLIGRKEKGMGIKDIKDIKVNQEAGNGMKEPDPGDQRKETKEAKDLGSVSRIPSGSRSKSASIVKSMDTLEKVARIPQSVDGIMDLTHPKNATKKRGKKGGKGKGTAYWHDQWIQRGQEAQEGQGGQEHQGGKEPEGHPDYYAAGALWTSCEGQCLWSCSDHVEIDVGSAHYLRGRHQRTSYRRRTNFREQDRQDPDAHRQQVGPHQVLGCTRRSPSTTRSRSNDRQKLQDRPREHDGVPQALQDQPDQARGRPRRFPARQQEHIPTKYAGWATVCPAK